MGSKNFRLDIPRLVEFHMQGRMKLDQLVSNRLKLDQINDGFLLCNAAESPRVWWSLTKWPMPKWPELP